MSLTLEQAKVFLRECRPCSNLPCAGKVCVRCQAHEMLLAELSRLEQELADVRLKLRAADLLIANQAREIGSLKRDVHDAVRKLYEEDGWGDAMRLLMPIAGLRSPALEAERTARPVTLAEIASRGQQEFKAAALAPACPCGMPEPHDKDD